VTTEDDFHAALDAHPDDWQTRLVFADWLEEHGDARADGYRALAALRRVPHLYESGGNWGFDSELTYSLHDGDELPDDWFQLMQRPTPHGSVWAPTVRTGLSRRAMEDAAARAFALLPAPRRKALLDGTAPPIKQNR
jgi:uncharacterized protein (TIGR02996 family)